MADPRMAAVEKASAALSSGGANLAADEEEKKP
jgi:hypothetical protein